MNTKLIMTLSSVVLGALGIALTFLPKEIGEVLGVADISVFSIVLQTLGALYFAFAMLNWTARANLIGGIYGRPVAIGNLTHFVIGALALIKAYTSTQFLWVLLAAILYLIFAALFTVIFFTHPVQNNG